MKNALRPQNSSTLVEHCDVHEELVAALNVDQREDSEGDPEEGNREGAGSQRLEPEKPPLFGLALLAPFNYKRQDAARAACEEEDYDRREREESADENRRNG
jgi:hypothetical protein